MSNKCDILITRGLNKGLKCHQVNRYCRHRKFQCAKCNFVTFYRDNFKRHQKKCQYGGANLTSVEQRDNLSPWQKQESESEFEFEFETRNEKDNSNSKSKTDSNSQEHLCSIINELISNQEQLNKKVNDLMVKNNNKSEVNIGQLNIAIIGDNALEYLSNRMGRDEAIKYLVQNAINANSIDVVDKLYLDGKDINDYPIACREDLHFRFLDENKNIVDDFGGHKIAHKLTDNVQTAMIDAHLNYIKKLTNTPRQEELWSVYDIRKVQSSINEFNNRENKENLRADLAIKVYNPTHPFFT